MKPVKDQLLPDQNTSIVSKLSDRVKHLLLLEMLSYNKITPPEVQAILARIEEEEGRVNRKT